MAKLTLIDAMRAHNSVTARRRSLDMYGSGLNAVYPTFRDEIAEIREKYNKMQRVLERVEVEI